MNSKCAKLLSHQISTYFITDKKKSGKRIKIVDLQQQNKSNAKKPKIVESNGAVKAKVVEKTVKANGNSIEDGKKMLEWLITGIDIDEFMRFVYIRQ